MPRSSLISRNKLLPFAAKNDYCWEAINLAATISYMEQQGHRYFVLNKPYNMVSQFISSHQVNLLSNLGKDFPEGIHAIGRLDNHSEGLLLLTTNKRVTRLLFSGPVQHKRTYLVQVNNELNEEKLERLRTGIAIRIKGGVSYTTPPCEVALVPDPELLYPGAVSLPLYGPHTWLLITLTEGKYHQVRKMIGALHHRCKRLIRLSIESLSLDGLAPGETREVAEPVFFEKLHIDYDACGGKKTKS